MTVCSEFGIGEDSILHQIQGMTFSNPPHLDSVQINLRALLGRAPEHSTHAHMRFESNAVVVRPPQKVSNSRHTYSLVRKALCNSQCASSVRPVVVRRQRSHEKWEAFRDIDAREMFRRDVRGAISEGKHDVNDGTDAAKWRRQAIDARK
jgi:hypothetical protein